MEKYNVQFTDTFGVKWYCGINVPASDVSGVTLKSSENPLSIIYDTSGGVRGRIIGSFAELEILYDVNENLFDWNEFIRCNSYEYQLTILKDNKLFWMGVLEPDLPTIPFKAGAFTLKLRFSDGFARLKNFNLAQVEDISPFTNDIYREKVLSVINRCVANTGLYYSYVNSVFNLVEYSQQVYMNRTGGLNMYYQSPESYANKTCYDVLFDLMTTFDAKILQRNGELWIVRYPEMINNSMTVWQYSFDNDLEEQIGILSPIKPLSLNEGGNKSQMFRFLKENGQMNFTPKINGFNLSFNYGARTLMRNYNFDYYGEDGKPIGWNIFEFVGLIKNYPEYYWYNNGLIRVQKDVVVGNTIYNKHLQLLAEKNKRNRSGIQDYNEKWKGETGIKSNGTNALKLNSIDQYFSISYEDLLNMKKLSYVSQTIEGTKKGSSLSVKIRWIGDSIVQYIDGDDDYKKKTLYSGATFYVLITLKTNGTQYYLNGDTWHDYYRIMLNDDNNYTAFDWHELEYGTTPTPEDGDIEIRIYQPLKNPDFGDWVTYNSVNEALYIDSISATIGANENVIEKKDAFDGFIELDEYSTESAEDQNMLIGDPPSGLTDVNYSFKKEYSNFIGSMLAGAISYPCNQWYDYATKYQGQLIDHLVFNLSSFFAISQIVLKGKMFAKDIDILTMFFDDNNLYGYNFYFQSLTIDVKKGISTITAPSMINGKYYKLMGTEINDNFIVTENDDYIQIKQK